MIAAQAIELDPFDARWREWQQKGHDADARFRRRLKTVLIDVVAAVMLAGALWSLLNL